MIRSTFCVLILPCLQFSSPKPKCVFGHKTTGITNSKKTLHCVISISTSAIILLSIRDYYYTSDSFAATYCPSTATTIIAGQDTETSRVTAAVVTTKSNNSASV